MSEKIIENKEEKGQMGNYESHLYEMVCLYERWTWNNVHDIIPVWNGLFIWKMNMKQRPWYHTCMKWFVYMKDEHKTTSMISYLYEMVCLYERWTWNNVYDIILVWNGLFIWKMNIKQRLWYHTCMKWFVYMKDEHKTTSMISYLYEMVCLYERWT